MCTDRLRASLLEHLQYAVSDTPWVPRCGPGFERYVKRFEEQHFQTFFFPLDGIGHWNRIYGHRGFYQYQCVIPAADARSAIAELLENVALSAQGSFLGVLKRFGSVTSPGMLSFPMPGVTLALDSPNRADRVTKLFTRLDAIVRATGGRLYPAKDSRMPRELFRDSFPR